jgi:hypothetical protein
MKGKETEKELLEFINNNLCLNVNNLYRPMLSLYDLMLNKEYGFELNFLSFNILVGIYYYLHYKGFAPSVFDLADFMACERTTAFKDLGMHIKRGLVIDSPLVTEREQLRKGKIVKWKKKIKIYQLSAEGKKVVESYLPIINKVNKGMLAKLQGETLRKGKGDLNEKLLEMIKKDSQVLYKWVKNMREEMRREGYE